jgi:transcriptional regulator with XRE-family HTH domain
MHLAPMVDVKPELRLSGKRGERPMLKKLPNPIDRHVGSRALGLTFQQVQKYEKGTNRISASRLQQIAKMLGVPVAFFFEGAPAGEAVAGSFTDTAATAYVADFLTTSEGIQLSKAFVRIKSPRVRRRVIDLVEALADESCEIA